MLSDLYDLVKAFFVVLIISIFLSYFANIKDPAMWFVIYLMAQKYGLERQIEALKAVPEKS